VKKNSIKYFSSFLKIRSHIYVFNLWSLIVLNLNRLILNIYIYSLIFYRVNMLWDFWNFEFPFSCLYKSHNSVRKWLHAGEQTSPCHEKTSRRARVIKGVIRTPDKSGLDHYKGRPLLGGWGKCILVEYTDLLFSKTNFCFDKYQSFKNLKLEFKKL